MKCGIITAVMHGHNIKHNGLALLKSIAIYHIAMYKFLRHVNFEDITNLAFLRFYFQGSPTLSGFRAHSYAATHMISSWVTNVYSYLFTEGGTLLPNTR